MRSIEITCRADGLLVVLIFFTLVLISGCEKKNVVPETNDFFRQNVSFILNEEETVLVEDFGCKRVPGIYIWYLTQFFPDKTIFYNGVKYPVPSRGIASGSSTYVRYDLDPEELNGFTYTRDFIRHRIETENYHSMKHYIEIETANGKYVHTMPLNSRNDDVSEGNFTTITLNPFPDECLFIDENQVFVDFRFQGYMHHESNPNDSIFVTFPDSRYYNPI